MPKLVAITPTGGILESEYMVELPAGLSGKLKIYTEDMGTIVLQIKQDKCIYIVIP